MFLLSLKHYTHAWLESFSKQGRRHAPLTNRRLAFLLLSPLFLILLTANWFCLFLDRLLFPSLFDVAVRRPVFVVGVPRSGTTYLHRALDHDPEFVAATTWEVAFAPSVIQRRLVRSLATMDQLLGAPIYRLLAWLMGSATASVKEVHAIALEEAEEDYLLLLSAAGCFFASVAFPANAHFKSLGHLEDMSEKARERLLAHYHRLLQRQLYDVDGTQYLSKNAVFASWVPHLARRYPDALFIICIRAPDKALQSQLTSLAEARSLFGSYADWKTFTTDFETHYDRWFRALKDACDDSGIHTVVVEQEWMRDHPKQAMELLYSRLDRAAPAATSRHEEPGGRTNAAEHAPTGGALDAPSSRISSESYLALRQFAESARNQNEQYPHAE